MVRGVKRNPRVGGGVEPVVETPFVILVALGGLLTVTVVIGLAVAATRSQRRTAEYFQRLQAYAYDTGWRPLTEPLPPIVQSTARSRRTKMALATERAELPIWMIWHRWTESDGESSRTVDLTRFYLWLGPSYPNTEIRRRSKLGGKLKPVRGIGTGDADFDRVFLIRPDNHPASASLLGPDLRREMLSGSLGTWQIINGVLITSHHEVPSADGLHQETATLTHLAQLLQQSAYWR